MSDRLLSFYHRLPGPMRSQAASLRGLYLRSWRYGRETGRLVTEALEREQWSPQQWINWQENRRSFMLHRAATQVPYYREQWNARRRRGDCASWEYLENWPILEKESLRKNPKAFIADDCDARRMFHESTSGTSGKPLDVWWTQETVRGWYALFEARCRFWYGVTRRDRWGILGGQLITPAQQRRPPFWVWNAPLNQLYMSSYHLAPDLVPFYLDALVHYRVRYLVGYSSSLYELAQEALRLGRRDLAMTVAITNAEPLFDYQRKAIAAAFQCPVRETYGMAEIVMAANECPAGRLHFWPEVSWPEVIEGHQPAARGTSGDFVSTGLINSDMPLIRYRLGDRGGLPAEEKLCACGRTLPLLAWVEGRADETLYTADGRRIGRLDPVFKTQLPVREAQIIQEALNRLRVKYVAAPDFNLEAANSIVERLRARMGDVNVILEQVDQVPRGANGKFRAVVCALSVEEKNRLSQQHCFS